jgi:sec-independent protein translocase protein TatA
MPVSMGLEPSITSLRRIGMTLPGGMEWILIVLVVVLLFGAKKIPELAKGLGLGIKEFKKASKETREELSDKSEDGSESESKGQ